MNPCSYFLCQHRFSIKRNIMSFQDSFKNHFLNIVFPYLNKLSEFLAHNYKICTLCAHTCVIEAKEQSQREKISCLLAATTFFRSEAQKQQQGSISIRISSFRGHCTHNKRKKNGSSSKFMEPFFKVIKSEK